MKITREDNMRADDVEHRNRVRNDHLRTPQFYFALLHSQLSPHSANIMPLNPLHCHVAICHMAVCVFRNLELLFVLQTVLLYFKVIFISLILYNSLNVKLLCVSVECSVFPVVKLRFVLCFPTIKLLFVL
jgi:hypothetical protein